MSNFARLKVLLFLISFVLCGNIGTVFANPVDSDNDSGSDRTLMLILPDSIYNAHAAELPPGVAWARFGEIEIFIGGEVDLVGIFGVELGGGIVIDLDTPLDSGIYVTVAAAAGINVGASVGGGVVVNGDLEGRAIAVDGNILDGSVVAGVGEDGGVLIGGGVGPGIGGSVSGGETGTLSIQNVIDFFNWLF